MSASEGRMLGDYRLARPIGTGGFSTVYLAHDDRLDAEVAVKVLAENRSLDIDARRRFVEEAQKLRKVRSAHIVGVLDVGETELQQPYMVLEYADRGDLAARLASIGMPLPSNACLPVVHFLHAALSALHEVSLVHRDVKPQNILIRTSHGVANADTALLAGNERLLLGDLGFVKDLDLASGFTVGGGTWGFQAPEQRQRLSTVDARADIFSACAVVASLLTNSRPSDGELWPTVVAESKLLGSDVRRELLRGMSEDPELRHRTIDEWHDAVIGALSAQPASLANMDTQVESGQLQGKTMVGSAQTKPAEPSVSPPEREGRASLRWSGRWVGAGALALLLGLGGLAVGSALSGGSKIEPDRQISNGIASSLFVVNGSEITISGPDEISVGERVTFVSEFPSDVTASWVYPDGSIVPSGTGVVYSSDGPGVFPVALLVVVPGALPELLVHDAEARE